MAFQPFWQEFGLESGMMIVQLVSLLLRFEMHAGAMPQSAFSTPTSVVKRIMCPWVQQQLGILSTPAIYYQVLACEFNRLRGIRISSLPAKHVKSLYNLVRKISKPLTNDRSTSKEIELIAKELSSGGWLARIEAECEL